MMPGRETRLRDAEQEAHDVEAGLAGNPGHPGCDHAPRNHDARDPAPRADALQDQVARDLEGEESQEEDAGAEPVDRWREAEILVHLQGGEADIGAVEIA